MKFSPGCIQRRVGEKSHSANQGGIVFVRFDGMLIDS